MVITGKYSRGVIGLSSNSNYCDQVSTFVQHKKFLDISEQSLIHKNQRNITYQLSAFLDGQDYILKHSRAGFEYSFLRRLSFILRSLRTNYSKKAFEGALLLEEAGVRTFEPIAYWSYWKSPLVRESYILYPKISAIGTYAKLREQGMFGEPSDKNKLGEKMFSQMVEIAQKIHESRLYHGDLATHNFLVVEEDVQGREDREDGEDRELKLVLLDTDHVKHRTWLSFAFFDRFFDMRNLRRIDFNPEEKEQFLRCYLGKDYRSIWLGVLSFWKWWGERPFGKLRRRITARGISAVPKSS